METNRNTRADIFRAAAAIFSEKGYECTSMRLIAERVGISKPAIYYHFSNKQDLYECLLQAVMEISRKSLQDIVAADKNPLEKLYDIALDRFDRCRDHPEISRFMHDAISGNIRKDISFSLNQFFDDHTHSIRTIVQAGQAAGIIRADLDFQTFIFAFIGALNMYTMAYLLGEDIHLTPQQARCCVDTLVEGIGQKTGTVISLE